MKYFTLFSRLCFVCTGLSSELSCLACRVGGNVVRLVQGDLLYLQVVWNRNTPGTAGGPGGRDRTLAVKSRKTSEKFPTVL